MHPSTRIGIGAAAAVLGGAAAFVHQRAWQAQHRNPPRGRFVEVDGVRLHYVERGEGPPLLMLHGLGSMVEELALSPLFELAAARYRVIAVDRPGYGYSSRPRGRWWGPQAQAALFHRLLGELGIERPVLLGHSFGALVALALAAPHHLAADRPRDVAGHAAADVPSGAGAVVLPVLPGMDGAAAHTAARRRRRSRAADSLGDGAAAPIRRPRAARR